MSGLVDGLVTRGYVTRRTHPADRRKMNLMLTERGEKMLQVAREGAVTELSERLTRTQQTERATILRAMRTLREVFPEEKP
jgi:DNA-binding MarR family transcriptional regulator